MRLIDADALKHHYSWWGTEVGDGTSKYEREVFDSIVDAQPTIEAVPVVHCKDCKKYIREVWERKLNEPHSFAETEDIIPLPGGCIGFEDAEKGFCYEGEKVIE